MSVQLLGALEWGCKVDKDSHRDYNIKWLLESDDPEDGPAVVMDCADLPAIGSYWAFGNDIDAYAYCHPDWSCSPVVTNEPNYWWTLDQTFSTRPLKRCQDQQYENPLAEPIRIGGSFVRGTVAAVADRFGQPLLSSSHELFRGQATEFDAGTHNVQIGINFATLPLALYAPLLLNLNDAPMWGVGARCVKFANARFTRVLYGTCSYFYSVDYEFDIDANTFDRDIPDEGEMCLKGWSPGSPFKDNPLDPNGIDADTGLANKTNPKNFEVYKDINGENARVLLDGQGRPITKAADQAFRHVEYHPETNLFVLGIPPVLS